MYLKLVILFVFSVVSIAVLGQELPDGSKRLNTPALSLSYFGEDLIHPGALLTFELPVWSHIKEREDSKIRTYTCFARVQAGYYHHEGSFEALFAQAGLGLCHTGSSGFYQEIFIGGGLLKTILPAPVYGLNDDGTVYKDQKSGTRYGLVSANFRLGYDFTRKGNTIMPFTVFTGLTFFGYGPQKIEVALNRAVEIGFAGKLYTLSRN